MKFGLLALVVNLSLLFNVAIAISPAEALALLPQCASSCLIKGVGLSTCQVTDLVCICADKPLWSNATECSLEECTTKEALSALGIAKTVCEVPSRDVSWKLLVTCPVLLVSGSILVIVRILARSPKRFELFGWDDSLIILSYIAGLGLSVLDYLLIDSGLGKDIWTVEFGDVRRTLFYFYLGESFYLLSTVLMKMSILAFYLRIFVESRVRLCVYVLMVALTCFTIAFTFTFIFQCSPISYAWDSFDNTKHGTCINRNAGVFAHAGLNIFFDLAVLMLPVPLLMRLQATTWQSKLQIGTMFSVGIIVTVISILRLWSLVSFGKTINPMYDYYTSALWSAVEIFAGIICACLPTARVFIMRILPQWLSQPQSGISTTPERRTKLRKAPASFISWPKSLTGDGTLGKSESTTEFVRLESIKAKNAYAPASDTVW